jgi:hypothetical protein
MSSRHWLRSGLPTQPRTPGRRPYMVFKVEALEDRTTPTAVAPPSGLVSWWTGDNSGIDLIGGNDATLLNGASYAAGTVADGFIFDGIDDQVQAPSSGLPTGNADRTIEMWVRIDQPVTGARKLFVSYGAPGTSSSSYGVGCDELGRLYVTTWGTSVNSNQTLQSGRWYHVAATNVDRSFTLFLDGVQIANGLMDVTTAPNSNLLMGQQTVPNIGNQNQLDGMVDEVSIYDRALSASEIQSIYSAGSDGKIKSPNYVAADITSVTEAQAGTASIATFTIRRIGTFSGEVVVNWSTADGTATSGLDYVAQSGQVVFLDGESEKSVSVNLVNDNIQESDETFFLELSTPTEGYAVGMGMASIVDDEVTKFFVVNDGTSASSDRTYQYGASGNGLVNTSLASGNTTPRGMASTTAGDKVWVVDANKTVYVYSAAGGLLGSWTAGSINGQAQVEGITVWGNDVWLVDAKQDKVFKYAGAATRLSGSQNAVNSFSLNTANKNPKDLVTDGTSVWVVDDAAVDKVFKYSLTGTSQGSWTIDAANASPTGITLDPSGASQSLWIVDSGTDRVYEYTDARANTSGNQTASATFALASGNTNPQGIADPPLASYMLISLPAVRRNSPFVYAAPILEGSPTTSLANESNRRSRRIDLGFSVNALQGPVPRPSASPVPASSRVNPSNETIVLDEYDYAPIDVSAPLFLQQLRI